MMSTAVMDNSNNSNQNLIMINDSGGVGAPGEPRSNSLEMTDGRGNYSTHHGGGPDLISTALDAANICAQDVEIDSMVETTPAGHLEEGIIYRNSMVPASSSANSKVHFISNLTLVAKQPHHQPGAAQRTGQNIIFLNNTPSTQPSGTSLIAGVKSSPAASSSSSAQGSYINAFVSSKSTSGKVVNLLQAGPKPMSGQSLIPHQTATRMGKNVQVLKRLPVQQPNPVARSTNHQLQLQSPHLLSKSGGTLHTQKTQNLLISGSSLVGATGAALKTMGSGKLVSPGLHNNSTMNGQPHKAPGGVTTTKYTKSHNMGGVQSTNASKMKSVQMSKYQPKVVQVQQQPGAVTTSAGGPSQWRLDMRGRPGGTVGDDEMLLAGQEVAGVVHRSPACGAGGGGIISVQGASATKIISMGNSGPSKYHPQPMLMMSGAKAGTGLHAVQMTSAGQYSVIGDDVASQQQGGAIKYVNAHGKVVQQQQHKHGDPHIHSVNPQMHNVIQYGSAGKKLKQQHQQQQHHPPPAEDVYYVNGTQMNDEMSARLLQSFSQKATSRYAAAQAATTTGVGVPQAPVKYQYSTQNTFEPTSVLQAPASGGSQKHGPDYIRVNSSDIQAATTTTFIDNIPLTTRLEDLPMAMLPKDHVGGVSGAAGVVLLGGTGAYLGHSSVTGCDEQDQEDIVGVEMRPAPISSTDERANALHAVLQDHTYVLLQRPGEQKPSNVITSSGSSVQYVGGSLPDNKELGIAMAMAEAANGTLFQQHQPPPQQQQQQQVKCTTTDLLKAAMGLGHYPLPTREHGQLDDDNCSVISNDSRSGKLCENDQGEETETAPEGDGEDDSVTRCICDLTHDDGYMICCDKCSTWQHVDCMGIDRMNIPDEYNCDVCQPRPMDRTRARDMQLQKRRDQQTAAQLQSMALGNGGLLFGALPGQYGAPTVPGGGAPLVGGVPVGHELSSLPYANGLLHLGGEGRPLITGHDPFNRNKLGPGSLKKNKTQLARRKCELGTATFSVKKQKRELMKNGVGGKRKEKKTLTKKRTTSGTSAFGIASKLPLVASGTEEKSGLKSWIDNYEQAITNHYSPELRARLQSIGKLQQQQQLLMSPDGSKSPMTSFGQSVNLRNIGDLVGKCTTVPHAGGKILISTMEVPPNSPIVELRGKFMLSNQYRQQNSLVAVGPGRNQANKPPGPFIFFYRLVNDATELCVDTRTYGNDARFVRRSCRPNAEIVHQLEKGTIHLYVVSLQQIRSSTEITIRHEPHDLLAVSRASGPEHGAVPQPTSTTCACGLEKDCLFYSASAATIIPLNPDAVSAPRPGKRLNGHAQKLRTTSISRGTEDSFGPLRRSKTTSRSTSSSGGESSTSLMSPNIPNGSAMPNYPCPSGVGILSPSSPIVPKVVDTTGNGVMLLQPKEEEKPTNLKSLATEPLMTVIKEELIQQQQPLYVEKKPEPIHVQLEVKDEPPPVPEEEVVVESPTPIKKEEPVATPVVAATELKIEQGECTLEEQMSLIKGVADGPGSATTTPSKKNKELKSLSEENLKAAPMSAKALAEESRKLTREERKMQAIMKAFEKMEKSSIRKQEGRKSGESSSGKRRDSTKDPDDRSIFKKKKRKGSKSYQQSTNQRKIRRKSQTNPHDDVFTSEESTNSLLASPPISVPYTYASANPLLPRRPNFDSGKFNGEHNSAANMLLSLANASPAGGVCMLVEAAIAPLEASSDFKMPKTKKSIMNDWLSSENSPGEKSLPFDSLLQAAQSVNDQPLKKGEEFIGQTEEGNLESNENRLQVPPPFPTPPSTGGSESAVKKRWLRQAISEECSDEAPASPTNGYSATPLKKRRFARQCSDFPDDASPSTPNMLVGSFIHSPVEEEEPKALDLAGKELKDDCIEEEIDVINSPKDCEPLVREEVVKIQPENEAEDDIRINVEEDEVPEEAIVEEEDVKPLVDLQQVPEESPILPAESKDEEPVAIVEEKADDQSLVEVKEEAENPIIKQEEQPETIEEDDKKIIPEEFDIEPLNPEEPRDGAQKSTGTGEDVNDEIADIQKRLSSFHAENILFLKSMNKKTKPNPSPQNAECLSAYSSASVSASSSAASSPIASPKSSTAVLDVISRRHSTASNLSASSKRKKLDFDAEEVAKDSTDEAGKGGGSGGASPEKRRRRTKSRFSSPIRGGDIELKDLNSNTVGLVKETEEVMNKSTFKPPEVTAQPTTHSYFTSGHAGYNSSTGAGHHSLMPSSMINTSIPPPPMSYSSMYNMYGSQTEPGIGMGPSPASSSQFLLTELLENAQKITNHTATGYASVTPTADPKCGLRPAASASQLAAPASQTAFFTLNSSPSLNKITFNAEASTPPSATTANRTLIRTASADPRLNPNLNATPETPPAPKRKLSINEYRKRMQQSSSCGSESNSSCASPTGGSSRELLGISEKSGGNSMDDEDTTSVTRSKSIDQGTMENNILESLGDIKEDDSNSCHSPSGSGATDPLVEEKVAFSAAPTLLERQQESISERLKNYKSVTELLTTKDGTPIITTILQNNPGSSILESLRASVSSAVNPVESTTAAPEEKNTESDAMPQSSGTTLAIEGDFETLEMEDPQKSFQTAAAAR